MTICSQGSISDNFTFSTCHQAHLSDLSKIERTQIYPNPLHLGKVFFSNLKLCLQLCNPSTWNRDRVTTTLHLRDLAANDRHLWTLETLREDHHAFPNSMDKRWSCSSQQIAVYAWTAGGCINECIHCCAMLYRKRHKKVLNIILHVYIIIWCEHIWCACGCASCKLKKHVHIFKTQKSEQVNMVNTMYILYHILTWCTSTVWIKFYISIDKSEYRVYIYPNEVWKLTFTIGK